MEALNWLLINGALAISWLRSVAKPIAVTVGGALDAALGVILSPILSVLNPPCTTLGDLVYTILSPLPVWIGLTLLSAIAGVVMLATFGIMSNQAAIGRIKDDIKANLLALKLYKDQPGVTWRAQAALMWAILRLQRYILVPVLVLALPMLLGLAQMGIRYQWRPLHSGEQTLIKLTFDNACRDARGRPFTTSNTAPRTPHFELPKVTLETGPGAIAEVGPIAKECELAWRIRGGQAGRHTLRFHLHNPSRSSPTQDQDTVIEKELIVGDGLRRVSATRPSRHWLAQLVHPVEPVLPGHTGVASVEVLYPGRDSRVYGTDYWVFCFFVVSMAFALASKPIFKVRF
ncbi:MAG: hypothetical protein ACE5HE_11390 [Phycisphaerae bacterium]